MTGVSAEALVMIGMCVRRAEEEELDWELTSLTAAAANDVPLQYDYTT